MSLINKMLQDLDARGSQPGTPAMPADVRLAGPVRRQLPVKAIAVGTGMLAVVAALAVIFLFKRPAPVAAPVVLAVPVAPVPVAPPVASPVPVAAPVAAPPVAVAPAVPVKPEPKPVIKQEPAPAPTPVLMAAAPPSKRVAEPVVRFQAEATRPAASAVAVTSGRDMTNSQRAESQYKKALDALEEGRVGAAMDGMTQALVLDPRHDAARQSLVGLLIESGRNDEAMQQLELGLAADAGQTSMAMLLARMQIERGKSGVPTLLRSLPAAGGNADYLAFLAGALQREGRHREAVEQYGGALRFMPEHSVWLMGMGISLEAEKRAREALAAFQRAAASGTLTAPLQSFVERKIVQLSR
jgi:MSHA biogenesis protein MshN